LDVFRAELSGWLVKNKKPSKSMITDEQIQNTVSAEGGTLMECKDPNKENILHVLADSEQQAYGNYDGGISMQDKDEIVKQNTVEQQFSKIYKVDAATRAHRNITIAAGGKYILGFKLNDSNIEYGVEN
jgi:hypothetical protein